MKTESSNYGQQHKITMIVDHYLNFILRYVLAFVKRKRHKFPASFKIQNSSNYNYLSLWFRCASECNYGTRNSLWTKEFTEMLASTKNELKKYLTENLSSSTPHDTLTLMYTSLHFAFLGDGKFSWIFGDWGKKLAYFRNNSAVWTVNITLE